MYSRDPFNLRKAPPSALGYLQTAASRAQKATEKAAEAVTETVQAATEKVKDADMSFKLPQAIPNFDSAQRKFEDHVWNKFSGDEKGLPMYKDKPTSYGVKRGGGRWGKKRIAVIALVVFGALYWLGWTGSGEGGEGVDSGKKSSWIPTTQSGKKGVDWNTRRESVRDAFLLSWKGYEEHGWGKLCTFCVWRRTVKLTFLGYDEYHPVSKTGRYMAQPNGMGWIIVDALDTLMVMNLTKELKHAREWVSTTLNYEKDQDVNTFETTIRMLGGLLSAHYLQDALPGLKPESANEEDLFLEKAADLADRLMGAFDSPSGVPWASVILKSGEGKPSHADGGASSTAEATTLQLELKYLAFLTGEPHYWEKAEKVMEVIDNNGAKDGLVPIFVYADKGTFRGEEVRLGSRGDSYYEYLLKQYLQTQKQEPVYLDMWNESLNGVKKHLLAYSRDAHLTVLAERPSGLDGNLHPKMDHLVCFYPGTIALGVTGGLTVAEARKLPGWGKAQEDDLVLARELMKTCMAMYRVNPTGLAGEITHFELADPPRMYRQEVLQSKGNLETNAEDAGWMKDLIVKPADSHNLQRPETVESLFYMWHITGDELYREWGWEMFENFVKHTIVENGGGFTSVSDVRTVPPPSRDNMESFWLVSFMLRFLLLSVPLCTKD